MADAAVRWVRIALFGAPFILVTMAGNGWMRGVQDTGRPLKYILIGNGISAVLCPALVYGAGWGLEGSAVANVVAQVHLGRAVHPALFAERVSLRPQWTADARAARHGARPGVAQPGVPGVLHHARPRSRARTSIAAVGAHQIVLQLWTFLALVLDSLAIAAQSLVGAALGASRRKQAEKLAWQVTRYGLVFGIGLGRGVRGARRRAAAGVHVRRRRARRDSARVVVLRRAATDRGRGVRVGRRAARRGRREVHAHRDAAARRGRVPAAGVGRRTCSSWGLAGIWTGLSAFMVGRLCPWCSGAPGRGSGRSRARSGDLRSAAVSDFTA